MSKLQDTAVNPAWIIVSLIVSANCIRAEEVKKAQEELSELAEIGPDIEAKIKDTEDEEREVKELAKNAAKEQFVSYQCPVYFHYIWADRKFEPSVNLPLSRV